MHHSHLQPQWEDISLNTGSSTKPYNYIRYTLIIELVLLIVFVAISNNYCTSILIANRKKKKSPEKLEEKKE